MPGNKIAAFIEESAFAHFPDYFIAPVASRIAKILFQKTTIIKWTETNPDAIFLFETFSKPLPAA